MKNSVIQNKFFTTYNESQFTFINKLLYWLDKCGKDIDGLSGKWIYNTLASWNSQFNFWSLSKLRRVIKSLEDSGILISHKRYAKNRNHTKWYSIDFKKLSESLKSSSKKHLLYNAKLHKEINLELGDSKNINREKSKENIVNTKPTETLKTKETRDVFRYVQNEHIIYTSNNKYIYSSNKEKLKFQKEEKPSIKITEQSKKIGETMINKWNEVFEYSLSPIKGYLTKQIIQILPKILKSKFNNSLEEWVRYAEKVNSSAFLMGEKKTKKNFKAQFAWLLREEVIDSIQGGAYGVGDRELDQYKLTENVKNKEYEVQYKTQQKVSILVEEKLEDETEKEEFKAYLMKERYEEDGDKYEIKKYAESLLKNNGTLFLPSSILHCPSNEAIKKTLYENYIMMKYLKVGKLELNEKIKAVFVKEKNKKLKFKLLNNMLDKITKIKIVNKVKSLLTDQY